ncbi:MAG TPA: helix-turn-helix domain-containing protein [Gemmataceae bacterium]|nr:helix-turn-helix domain-containing protein [Gemmataceae bacterium]
MYLTVRQAADELGGVSPSTVYSLVGAGRLDHIRIGLGRGTIRILKESVDRLK